MVSASVDVLICVKGRLTCYLRGGVHNF